MAVGSHGANSDSGANFTASGAQFVEYEAFIEAQLRKTRSQVRGVDIATASMVLLAGTVSYFFVAVLADHWLIRGGRCFFGSKRRCVIERADAGWWTITEIVPLLLRRINPLYAAQTIEHSRPTLKNALVNFLLFRSDPTAVHKRVFEQIEQQAATSLAGVEVESTVDRSRLVKIGYVLVALVALGALYALVSPKNPFKTVSRVFMPWADIAPPTSTVIDEIEPGNTQAFRGQQVTVKARVQGVPDDEPVLLYYTTADRQIVDRAVEMSRPADDYRHVAVLPAGDSALQQSITYRIEAGDARSRDFEITVVAAPTIVVKSVAYKYPAYTGLLGQRVELQGDLKAIEGTEVTLEGLANQPIGKAYIDFDANGTLDLSMHADGSTALASFRLGVSPDRKQPEHERYQLLFQNTGGKQNPQPVRHRIEVIADLAPVIQFVEPTREEVEIPLDGSADLELVASDPDFALAEVTLVVRRGDKQLLNEKLLKEPWHGQFVKKLRFSPQQHQLAAGDVVEYHAVAVDNKSPGPNRTETSRRRIRITSPTGREQRDQLAQNDSGQPEKGEPSPSPDGAKGPNQPDNNRPDDQQPENPQGDNSASSNSAPEDTTSQPQQDQAASDNQSQDAQPQGEQHNEPQDAGDKSGDKSDDRSGEQNEQSGDQSSGANQQAGDQQSSEESGSGEQSDGSSQQGGQSGDKQSGGDQSGQQQSGGQQSGQQQSGGQQSGGQQKGGQQAGGKQSGEQQSGEQSGDNQGANAAGDRSQSGKQNGKQSSGKQSGGDPSAAQQEQDNVASDGTNDGDAIERILKHRDQQKSGAEGQSGQQSSGKQQGAKSQPDGAKSSDGANAGDENTAGEKQPADKQSGQQDGTKANDGQSGDKSGQDEPSDKNDSAGDQPGANDQPGDSSAGQKSGKQPGSKSGRQQHPAEGQQPSDQSPTDQSPGEKPGSEQSPGAQGKQNEPGATRDNNTREDGSPQNSNTKGQGAQSKDDPTRTSDQNSQQSGEQRPDAKGGDGQQEKGESGAGQKSDDNAGSPSPQESNQPRQKSQQPGSESGEKKPEGDEQSPSTSKRESDSSSDADGDRSGGGEKGGGQKANQSGTGGAGQNTAADEGAGQSEQSGDGETGQRAGNDQQSPGQSGQKGSQPGQGSNSQSGAGSDQPGGEQPPGDSSQGAADKTAGGRSDGPGSPGGEQGGANSPKGAEGPTPEKPWQPGTDRAADPNLEYTRKATDLALEHLRDQLADGRDDSELLKQLGWTREEADAFLERWEALRGQAQTSGTKGDAARRELDETLRSLGLRPRGSVVKSTGKADDRAAGLQESRRTTPPPEYSEAFKAYTQGTARGGK